MTGLVIVRNDGVDVRVSVGFVITPEMVRHIPGAVRFAAGLNAAVDERDFHHYVSGDGYAADGGNPRSEHGRLWTR